MPWPIVINIVVGVVLDNNQCLLTQRAAESEFGGLWEFPGGKIEVGETPSQALKREILEEINLQVLSYRLFDSFIYQYPHKQINFHVYLIDLYKGKPQCLEKQLAMRWVDIYQLNNYSFPKANEIIIRKLLQSFATTG